MKTFTINGRVFKKSSSSLSLVISKCVGVSISDRDVLVTNVSKNAPILNFTRDEWDAFIKGVKNGEFNLDEEINGRKRVS